MKTVGFSFHAACAALLVACGSADGTNTQHQAQGGFAGGGSSGVSGGAGAGAVGQGAGGIGQGAGGALQGAGGIIQSAGGAVVGAGGVPLDTGGANSAGGPSGGSAGTTGNQESGPAALPTFSGCPAFSNGAVVQLPRANGSKVPVTIYVDPGAKSKPAPGGPLVVYWHATLSSPSEVHQGFGDANIQKVTSMGGVVAAPATTACTGCTTTDDNYWYVEDDVVLDEIVACAIEQANIDTKHIHSLGWSAGALHADHVALARSNYIASVISYSGGALFPVTNPDPSNHVATIQTYGTTGDSVIIDFPTQSKSWYNTYQPQGWYTMMCKHPGGHAIDSGVAPVSLQFFMDHPYKVSPEPYANAIPSSFPTYCGNTIQ